MIIVRGNKRTEAGILPDEKLLAPMAKYHDELVKAGVLLDAAGLHPTSGGLRIQFKNGKRSIVDGPFTESKELVSGYTLIQVKTREEGLEWARRFPSPFAEEEGEIEVRQLYEVDDLGSSKSLDVFREFHAGKAK
jgi:hypothetical protein